MKPIFTKKNGTSQRVAAIEVKMPASYPSANVTYGSGSVEDALDGFIVENKTVWSNLTLAANSSTSVQTSDISKSGYTPIGIVGYSFDGSYGNCLSYSKLTVSGNILTYLVANNGNSSASVNCVVQILYKKAKQ